MNRDYGDPLYSGTNLTLTCSTDLDEDLVDIPVIVSTSWMKNDFTVIIDSTHSEQQPFAVNSAFLTYAATYSFAPLDDSFSNTDSSDKGDSGAYHCDLKIMADVSDSFVRPWNSSSTNNVITVLGEFDV